MPCDAVAKMMKRPTKAEKLGLSASKAKSATGVVKKPSSTKPKPAKKRKGTELDPVPDEEDDAEMLEAADLFEAKEARRAEISAMQVDAEPTQPVAKSKKGGLKAKAAAALARAGDKPQEDYIKLYERSQQQGKRHR